MNRPELPPILDTKEYESLVEKYRWMQLNSNVSYTDSSRKGVFKDNFSRFKSFIGLDNNE